MGLFPCPLDSCLYHHAECATIGKQDARQFRLYADAPHDQHVGSHYSRTWLIKQAFRRWHINHEDRCRIEALEELEYEQNSPYYPELLREAERARQRLVDSQVSIELT